MISCNYCVRDYRTHFNLIYFKHCKPACTAPFSNKNLVVDETFFDCLNILSVVQNALAKKLPKKLPHERL